MRHRAVSQQQLLRGEKSGRRSALARLKGIACVIRPAEAPRGRKYKPGFAVARQNCSVPLE